jgi:hypothetical protein
MERLINCNFIIDIELIENISGANQYFEILFTTEDKTKFKIIYKCVWDMRYSIENASIERFCQFRKYLTDGLIDNSAYVVENSEYIKYFEHQVSGTLPVNKLKHYIFSDSVDTTIDILSFEEPEIIKV